MTTTNLTRTETLLGTRYTPFRIERGVIEKG